VAVQRGDLAAAAAAYEAAFLTVPLDIAPPALSAKLSARLALLLPSQGKIAIGEKQLTGLLVHRPDLDGWALRAVLAWLAWRAGQDASSQIVACRACLPETETRESLRVRALMDDLAGNWSKAAETYQALGQVNGVALALIRAGDSLFCQGRSAEAGGHYDAAAAIWQKSESSCGMALIHYRRAELAWQARHNPSVLAQLEEALAALAKAPASLQTEPRASIQKALARVKKGQSGHWEDWTWQPFDDLFRIQLLFPLFEIAPRNNP
jgi:tetratricopeptide (TPR) repeat protein